MTPIEQTFVIPKNHIHFKAQPLINNQDDELMDCAIAYIEVNGGGPTPAHTHEHDHLFTVLEGCVTIHTDEEIIHLNEGMSYRVKGTSLHSVWNACEKTSKVLGISLIRKHDTF